jgi:hypothetical protein
MGMWLRHTPISDTVGVSTYCACGWDKSLPQFMKAPEGLPYHGPRASSPQVDEFANSHHIYRRYLIKTFETNSNCRY